METVKTQSQKSQGEHGLGDESFMSATDLRNYMTEMQMARATKGLDSVDRAAKARQELTKTLTQPVDLTDERLREIGQNLLHKLRAAAQRGETELMVMRFPVDLCSDHGRAVNNADPDWPATLTGRPRQAFELWQNQLKAAGYKLKAQIIEWPGGMPGDVGFFLSWGEKKAL